jgi:hypothetical protein
VSILEELDEKDEKNNNTANNFYQTLPKTHHNTSSSSNYSSNSNSSSTTTTTTTLNECFELFTQTEELTDENSWKCSKCKQQTNAYKNLCMSNAPPILIIHLKRFFYRSNTTNFKLTTPVWFPVTNLDIGKYVMPQDDDYDALNLQHRTPYVYDLFAVCNHKGQNMANGHYTAFCKNPVDTRWYCFDDSNCTSLSEQSSTTTTTNSPNNIFNNGFNQVCTENAYILFYKKRNCMTNEKWWINYIDRSLYSSPEFVEYYNDLSTIEKLQQQNHAEQQQHQNNLQQNDNSKKSSSSGVGGSSSLKSSLKHKILGTSKSTSNLNTRHSNNLVDYNQSSGAEHPVSNLISFDDPNRMVNYYDENKLPRRIQQNRQIYHYQTPTMPSSVYTSPVYVQQQQQVQQSRQVQPALASTVPNDNLIQLDPHDIIFTHKMQQQMRIGSSSTSDKNTNAGDILSYPPDNEYTYNQIQPRIYNGQMIYAPRTTSTMYQNTNMMYQNVQQRGGESAPQQSAFKTKNATQISSTPIKSPNNNNNDKSNNASKYKNPSSVETNI